MIIGDRSPSTAGYMLLGEFGRTVHEIEYRTKVYRDEMNRYTVVTNDMVVQTHLSADDYVRWSCMGLEDGTSMK